MVSDIGVTARAPAIAARNEKTCTSRSGTVSDHRMGPASSHPSQEMGQVIIMAQVCFVYILPVSCLVHVSTLYFSLQQTHFGTIGRNQGDRTTQGSKDQAGVHSGPGLSSSGPCRRIVVSLPRMDLLLHRNCFPRFPSHQSTGFGLPSYRYRGSVQFLATESRETSPDDVVLFCKAYPGWFATSGHISRGMDGGLRSRGLDVLSSAPAWYVHFF